MKRLIFALLLLGAAAAAPAAERIDNIESEIRAVLDKVSPSLVKVIAENSRKYVATGIAMDRELVITSSLVTRHSFRRISVETVRGETIAARLAGQDPRSGLALLRLERSGPPPLPRSRQADIGSWAALVGLFYDRFPAIFQGIVSSRGDNELIVNAPVAPGSAGGAVVNKKGELLGIIRGSVGFSITPDYTFKDHAAAIVVSGERSESGSLCYAIPIDRVARIAETLKTAGRVVPGWLGLSFNSESNQVVDVARDSPAVKAGIAKGDRIEEIAGKAIVSFRDIASALEFRMAGDKVDLTVSRAGKPRRLVVELGAHVAPPAPPVPPSHLELPEPVEEGFEERAARRLAQIPEVLDLETALPRARSYVIELTGSRQLGIDVMEITPELGRKFGIKEEYGLLVSRVNEESAARRGGLQAGDVIVLANGAAMRSTSDLRRSLNSLKEKEPALIELYRDGRRRKFQLVPDEIKGTSWDVRRFAQKLDDLKGRISDEAKLLYQDEIRKLKQVREKEQAELQKQRQSSLLTAQEESRRLADEIRKLQLESSRLKSGTRSPYADELKRIQEALLRIQEEIRRQAGEEAEK